MCVFFYLNAFRAAGECRRQFKNATNLVKNVNIVELHDHIWNHHEKCIQISTNIPGIGSVIPEITCEMLAFEKTNTILFSKTNARVLSVKSHVSITGNPTHLNAFCMVIPNMITKIQHDNSKSDYKMQQFPHFFGQK